MLVFTRKTGESVCIRHDIEVKVLAVRGGAVSIGISAPPKVVIRREEISRLPEEAKRHDQPERATRAVVCSAGAR